MTSVAAPFGQPRLGLAENRGQFWLLVVVNAFVGAMVGLERSTLPLVARREFGIAAATAAMSFIATFGGAKAFTNLLAGGLVGRFTRRSLLLAGWTMAVPVPVLILRAPNWSWIVAANALLGASQGLTWSLTVIMKIDLVGPRRRGLAMGLNEFAGYGALALLAFASAVAAERFGLREGPAYLGLLVAVSGLLLSALFVRDTGSHAALESSLTGRGRPDRDAPSVGALIRTSLWRDARLFSVCQAGMVNNLNDGLVWGALPVLFAAGGASLDRVGLTVAAYPAIWSIVQLGTGALSDRWGRRGLVVCGMIVQGIALMAIAMSDSFGAWLVELTVLGVGTAMVYPALLAAVGDLAEPSWRAAAVGVYRLWRDLGYVAGALVAGALTDVFGLATAISGVGLLTIVSGIVAAIRWRESPVPLEPRTS